MPAPPRRPERTLAASTRRRRGLLVLVGLLYASGASTTTPFTWPANILTAVPIVAMAVAVCWRWPLRPSSSKERHGHDEQAQKAVGSGLVAWGALFAVVVAWELVEYFAPGSRGAHPTLSSMGDAVERETPLKAVVFAAWLALGAWIVHAGSRRAAPPS